MKGTDMEYTEPYDKEILLLMKQMMELALRTPIDVKNPHQVSRKYERVHMALFEALRTLEAEYPPTPEPVYLTTDDVAAQLAELRGVVKLIVESMSPIQLTVQDNSVHPLVKPVRHYDELQRKMKEWPR
jgi:hypothetical protein